MNVWSFTGNLGGDVKVNKVSDQSVANFSVAVKSGYGDKATTIWAGCALWGKQAESKLVDYLLKGQMVAVSGELSMREHDGKLYPSVRVNSVSLVGGKSEGGSNPAPRQQQLAPQQSQQSAPPDSFSDNIPFAPAHYLMGA